MNNIKQDRKTFQELHKHEGTKNYEVVTLVSYKDEAKYFVLDTVSKHAFIDAFHKPLNKEENTFKAIKLDSSGSKIDVYETHTVLKDGTMFGWKFYTNWIITGDKTENAYKDPLNEDQQNSPEKWLEVFKELYNEASYVHVFMSDYYFKIDSQWFRVKTYKKAEALNIDIKKKYPPKENQDVRMMELRDLCPDFFLPRSKRDTTFVDFKGYEQTDSEKGTGINPIDYSAGNYYLELYMPLGDTVKIKRHGSMGVNMQFYKIPVTQDGRNDVVFIVQEPNEMYPNKEFGGMYVVRPKNPDQEQYGRHDSSADSYSSQYNSTKGAVDTEAMFLKPMGD